MIRETYHLYSERILKWMKGDVLLKKKVLKLIKAKANCGICVSRAVSPKHSMPVEDVTERIREYGKKLAKDPVAAKAMLIGTGMYDDNGKLKEEFR